MSKTKSTKRALLSAILALVMTVSMLVGTTFAWFTDSVTSAGNKIVAGNLDVELHLFDGTKYVDISNSDKPIFGEEGLAAAADGSSTLWEPGKTQVAYLAIKNNGSLALKYKVSLNVTDITKNLDKVVTYTITPNAKGDAPLTAWDGTNAKSVVAGDQVVSAPDVAMQAGDMHYFALSVHMDELAGNEYMNASISFDITVLASQLGDNDFAEDDSFGDDYDAGATYPVQGMGEVKVADFRGFVNVYSTDDPTKKVGSVEFEKIDSDAEKIVVTINENSNVYSGITVDAGKVAKTYDINVDGVEKGTDVTVTIEFEKGLARSSIVLYHYDDEIDIVSYNPSNGKLVFKTSDFSPFTVEYVDEVVDFVVETPEIQVGTGLPLGMPVADLTKSPEYINTEIAWTGWGGFNPSNLNQQLETAYTFTCPTDEYNEMFDLWYADFVVKMSEDVPEGSITLGGNYGGYGWVGFDSPEVDGNTEIPLLGSLANNSDGTSGWTYADIKSQVGTFICGIGRAVDSFNEDGTHPLDGATFTVCLRLTNYLDTTEYYDVNIVTYIMGTVESAPEA